MSVAPDLPQLALDPESFLSALRAGELDRCLSQLRQAAENAEADLVLNCRTAEALMHAGRVAEAVECCRRAHPKAGDDPAALRICAWTFSNAECHEEAAGAYRQLLLLDPDWVEGHRHLSGSLVAAGCNEAAIAHALTASDLMPSDAEFALHAGSLLLAAGRADEAIGYLDRAVALQPGDPRCLCRLAAARHASGESEAAARLAWQAALMASADDDVVIEAAEVLMRCARAERAAPLLRDAAERSPERPPQARLFRVLSAAEMLCGRLDMALAAVDRALAAEPDNPEYQIHRGQLLWRVGDIRAAAAAFDRAAALDPENGDTKRAQMSLLLVAGLMTEATAVGGELLQRFPDNKPAAEAVLHLLNHRLDTIDGEYVVLEGGGARAERPPHASPGIIERWRTQRRVIGALIIRETRTRFGESKLGYGWALIEPILHIALLSATFSVLMHGQPPIGRNFFIFYYTGLIPYHLFVHASSGMSHAITGNGPLLQLPPVTTFDVITARGLLEIATDVIVALLLLAGFGMIGLAALPDDIWGPCMALLTIAAFGCGLGYVNAVVTVFFRSWEKTYGQAMRVLYFVSGIFYVPAMMPDWARDALSWNPLLHAIDWFRAGFFGNYQPHWLDPSYLVVVAILALLAGLALERGLRRRLSVPL